MHNKLSPQISASLKSQINREGFYSGIVSAFSLFGNTHSNHSVTLHNWQKNHADDTSYTYYWEDMQLGDYWNNVGAYFYTAMEEVDEDLDNGRYDDSDKTQYSFRL